MALRSRAPLLPPYQKFRCKIPGKMPAKRRFPEHVPQNEERLTVHPRHRFREKQKQFCDPRDLTVAACLLRAEIQLRGVACFFISRPRARRPPRRTIWPATVTTPFPVIYLRCNLERGREARAKGRTASDLSLSISELFIEIVLDGASARPSLATQTATAYSSDRACPRPVRASVRAQEGITTKIRWKFLARTKS